MASVGYYILEMDTYTLDTRFRGFVKAVYDGLPVDQRMCGDAFAHYNTSRLLNSTFAEIIEGLEAGTIPLPGHQANWAAWVWIGHRSNPALVLDRDVRIGFLHIVAQDPGLCAVILLNLFVRPNPTYWYAGADPANGEKDVTQEEVNILLEAVGDRYPGIDFSAVPRG